ncbi:hypothetical protein VTK26DRAFT_8865 [Humicola hyalothermophila]
MASLLSALLLLGVAASPAKATIAAWWNGIGPQILIQNATTGQIRYSACNRRDVPRYSYTDGSVLSLTYKPKIGTPLAGVGWWNEIFTIASIFYIEESGEVANGYFECNMSTGLFQSTGNWIISGNRLAPSIHPDTGLAAVVLGATAGYRVYYHDNDGAINELAYTPGGDWEYLGVISNDINNLPALAATFTDKENITVVSARDDSNIALTRYNKDETWHRATIPRALKGNLTNSETNLSPIALNETARPNFILPAWDGTPSGLGISLDKNSARTLWYIGNDTRLYSVVGHEKNDTWELAANQSSAFWPLADEPNGPLAVAYESSSSKVRVYYMVNGQLSEIKYEGGS